MDEEVANLSPRAFAGAATLGEEPAIFNYDPMTKKETLELVRCYYMIPDRKMAKKLFDLIKSMASPGEDEDNQES